MAGEEQVETISTTGVMCEWMRRESSQTQAAQV